MEEEPDIAIEHTTLGECSKDDAVLIYVLPGDTVYDCTGMEFRALHMVTLGLRHILIARQGWELYTIPLDTDDEDKSVEKVRVYDAQIDAELLHYLPATVVTVGPYKTKLKVPGVRPSSGTKFTTVPSDVRAVRLVSTNTNSRKRGYKFEDIAKAIHIETQN